MTKLPSMPLFVDEYEAATAHLSMVEDGAYNRLLRLCWRTHGCSVPDDPSWIRRHMRADQQTYDRVVAPIIEEFFTRKNGRVFQKRLAKEFRYVTDAVRKKKEGGRKGGKAKALKDKENTSSTVKAKPAEKPDIAIAPTLTPTLTLTPSKKESSASGDAALTTKRGKKLSGKLLIGFLKFWDIFDYKRGKREAADAWLKLKPDDALLVLILDGAKREASARPGIESAGRTPKMAEGWLSGSRWEDQEAVTSNDNRSTTTQALDDIREEMSCT